MRILETFGFTKTLNLTIDMEKSKFIEFLQNKIKPNRLFFFDVFDQELKEFYGKLSMDKFWLRRKSPSLFPESPFASAKGKIINSSNKTEIEIKIIGWNWFLIFWLLAMSLVFALALSDIIRTESYGVIIIFVPMFLILYSLGIFKIRNGVKKLENYILNELK